MHRLLRSTARFAPLSLPALAATLAAATATAAPASLASPSPSAAAAPPAGATPSVSTVPADPALTARAKSWFDRVRADDIDRSQLDARMNAALTDEVATNVARQATALGAVRGFAYVERRTVGKVTMYLYRVTFPATSAVWVFALDPDGKIAGLSVAPTPGDI